ncbi:MAG: MGMT family protein [Candidatus Odinarchaeia archaeon]
MSEKSVKITSFQKKVYEITSKIPAGYIATYSQIACIIGNKNSARAVGNALHNNPFPSSEVPCHRVIKENGEVGGYAKGTREKIKKLTKEGVTIHNGKIDLKKYRVNDEKLRGY